MLNRYSRNLAVNSFSEEQQQMLFNSSVLVVGAGGLGSALLQYLVMAGVGRVGVVEYDTVNETNLQRQILYSECDLSKNKGAIAVSILAKKNSAVELKHYDCKFTKDNGLEIASNYDIIVDCSDNYEARYSMDWVSQQLEIPFVYATAEQLGGQLSTFNHNGAGSYTALFPTPPQTDKGGVIGVLSPVPGVIGSLQALEVIKILTNSPNTLSGKLLIFNLESYETQIFDLV